MDDGYLADAARGVWHYVSRGNACELAFTPDNGTLYELVFTGNCSLLNRAADWMDHDQRRSITQDRPELESFDWLIVSWLGHGAWPVDLTSVWHESYFVEKYAACTEGDAVALRALLLAVADVAGLRPVAVVR